VRTGLPIFLGYAAVVVWSFRAWPWYAVVGAILGFSLLSGPLVNHRVWPIWLTLRVLCAVALRKNAGSSLIR
jgi:hypothetical protein